jgi:nitrogen-specific signal transduction histidine kinase
MEQNQIELEAQLRQAQKMETIGTLAAGVAHDFNNLLLVINGFTELIQMDLEPDDPHKEPIDKILNAGKRAAELVNQLLAFSRKQIIKPEIVNLENAITKTEKMLRRLIGEHIILETIFAPDLWSVKIDPSQLEQVVVNLAVNARDAMPKGGKLIIEAANVTLDNDYVAQHLGSQPGNHVLLAISDTGFGMSDQMQARIFEPFFTTKEVGKGTGLGLATVFGIVKQNGGNIWVYSEEGVGTTFKIYLPGIEISQQTTDKSTSDELPHGNETILIVEDDTGVRKLTKMVLQGQGFTVLEAKDGNAALQLAHHHTGSIHLLLTDVVMPGISGKALSQKLTQTYSHLKTLFMSGYTDNAVVNHGILDSNVAFLQKPFSPKALLYKVRTVLDS